MRIPKAHQSTAVACPNENQIHEDSKNKHHVRRPEKKGLMNAILPEFRMTSGARYSGVPQRV